jgi:hypothetical protein
MDPISNTVTEGIQRVATEQGGNFLTNILMAPFRGIGGAFSGLFNIGNWFSGAMWMGLPLLGLSHFAPNLLRSLGERFPQLNDIIGHLTSGSWGERLAWAGGIGVGAGAGLSSISGLLSGIFGGGRSNDSDSRESSNGGGIMGTIGTLAMTGAVVAIGAVLVRQVQHSGEGSPEGAPGRVPPPSRLPSQATAPQQQHS